MASDVKYDDDEYNPTSPSNTGSRPAPPRSSPPYNPTEEQYDPDAPAIKRESGELPLDCFDLKGDPFAPTNLVDVARPIVMKRVRCHNKEAQCTEMMELQTFVPAYLLRRKNEAPVPADKDAPWFWGQAWCFQCQLSYM